MPFSANRFSFCLGAVVWACLSVLPVVQADDSAKVLLRYRFQPGQHLQYEDHLHDQYEIQFGTDADAPSTLQDSRKSLRVVSVAEDGSAILELSLDAVRVELTENEESLSFDSAGDSDPPEKLAGIRDMLGKPRMQVTVSPLGTVTAIRNLLHPDQEIDLDSQIAQDILTPLPEEPVAVGDSWKENFEVAIPLANSQLKKPCKIQRRYTLERVEHGQAVIQLKTVVLTPFSNPDEQLHLLRRTPSGTIVIDIERGTMLHRVTTQENQVVGIGGKAGAITFKQRHEEKLIESQASNPSATSR